MIDEWTDAAQEKPPDLARVLAWWAGDAREAYYRSDLDSWAIPNYGTKLPIRWWRPAVTPPPATLEPRIQDAATPADPYGVFERYQIDHPGAPTPSKVWNMTGFHRDQVNIPAVTAYIHHTIALDLSRHVWRTIVNGRVVTIGYDHATWEKQNTRHGQPEIFLAYRITDEGPF